MSIEFLGSMGAGPGGQPLPFSPAVKAGPFVFVSGQVAMGENGTARALCARALPGT